MYVKRNVNGETHCLVQNNFSERFLETSGEHHRLDVEQIWLLRHPVRSQLEKQYEDKQRLQRKLEYSRNWPVVPDCIQRFLRILKTTCLFSFDQSLVGLSRASPHICERHFCSSPIQIRVQVEHIQRVR